VSQTKEGHVVLTISDHLDWENTEEHLRILREKINTYLRFVERDEIYKQFPEARGCQLDIQLVSHYPVPKEASSVLRQATNAAAALGVAFKQSLFAATPFKN
jgi:hypothetical protein